MTAPNAADALDVRCEEIIEKIVAKRGHDDVGEGDLWDGERLEDVGDWTYDLAVEIRKLREADHAWWSLAWMLDLPGSGPSLAKGRTGSNFARQVWVAAWGQTYDSKPVPRKSKEEKVRRAISEHARSYFSEADDDNHVKREITGRLVTWVTRLPAGGEVVASRQKAIVHDNAKRVSVLTGPQGRYVEFYEQPDPNTKISGPLRAVYLNRIIEVGV